MPRDSTQTFKVGLNLRPLKFAYFFLEDDERAFERVVCWTCTQWGGIRSVLVPVTRDATIWPLFQQFLKLHTPDRFVGYFPDGFDTAPLVDALRGIFPHLHPNVLSGPSWEPRDDSAHALSVLADGREMPIGLASPALVENKPRLTVYSPATEDALERRILLALFGEIYPGQEEMYRQQLSIGEAPASFQDSRIWTRQHDRSPFGSILNLTSYGLGFREIVGTAEILSYHLIIADDVPGLCTFWNYRAERDITWLYQQGTRRTLLAPPVICGNTDSVEAILRLIRETPAIPNATSDIDLLITCLSKEAREELEATLRSIGRVELPSRASLGVSRWFGHTERVPREADRDRVLRCFFQWRPLCQSFREGFGGRTLPKRLAFELGSNEIVLEPPDGFRNHWGGRTALDIVCDIWKGYPRDPAVAELIVPGGRFSAYGFSAEVAMPERDEYFTLAIPARFEALKTYFSSRGFEIRTSAPAQYASALLGLVGGLARASVFVSVLAYRVLDALSLRSSKKVAQRIVRELRLQASAEEDLIRVLVDAEVGPELKKAPRTLNELSGLGGDKRALLALLEELSSLGVVKRGFHATCPNCATPNWYPLYAIGESLTCPGCSTSFLLPVEHKKGSGTELIWEYTLNSLVNRVMDQDALPGILAVYHETKPGLNNFFVPGLELVRTGEANPVAEFDYLFVRDQEIFAGECKAGSELAEKDMETARLASSLGVRKFAFCTLRQFSSDANSMIEKLKVELTEAGSGMVVKTLSGQELLGGVLP